MTRIKRINADLFVRKLKSVLIRLIRVIRAPIIVAFIRPHGCLTTDSAGTMHPPALPLL